MVDFTNRIHPDEVVHQEPPGQWLMMSHLVWIYSVCLTPLNSKQDIAWMKHLFEIFPGINFVVCILALYGLSLPPLFRNESGINDCRSET